MPANTYLTWKSSRFPFVNIPDQCAHAHVMNKMANVATFEREREKKNSLSVHAVSCFKKINFQWVHAKIRKYFQEAVVCLG